MFNKFFKLFAALSIVGMVAFSVGCKEYDGEIDDLQQQIDDLKADANTLKKAFDAAQQTYATLTDLNNAKAEIQAAYEKEIAALDAKITTLRNEVNTKTAALEKAQSDLEAAVKANAANITALEAAYKAADAELKTAINNLTNKVADYETVKANLANLTSSFDELKNKIEGEGGYAEQLAAIKKQFDDLKKADEGATLASMYAAISEMLDDLADIKANLPKDPETGELIDVEKYVEGQIKALEDVYAKKNDVVLKSTWEAYMKTYDKIMSMIFGGTAEGWEAKLAEFESIWEKNGGWLEGTNTGKSLVDAINSLKNDILSMEEIKEEIEKTYSNKNNAFVAGVKAILADADIKSATEIMQEVNALLDDVKADWEALADRLSKLENAIKDANKNIQALINRIQSLVFVPTHEDMKMHIGGQYIQKIEGSTEVGPKIVIAKTSTNDVTYRVSPADIAEKLVEAGADFSFYYTSVISSRAAEGEAPIEVVGTPTATEDGLLVFKVKVNEDAPEGKTWAVALSVKGKALAEGVDEDGDEDDEAGEGEEPESDPFDSSLIEYTTVYTPVAEDGQNVLAKFVFGYDVPEVVDDPAGDDADDEGEEGDENEGEETPEVPTVWKPYLVHADQLKTDVVYTDLSAYTAFDGCTVRFQDGEDYLTLEEAKELYNWDFVPDMVLTAVETYPKANGLVDGTYTVKDRLFQLTAANAKNISKSKKEEDARATYLVTVSLCDPDNDTELVQIQSPSDKPAGYCHRFWVTKEKITVNATAELTWNYGIWNDKGAYENIEVKTDPALTADQLTALNNAKWIGDSFEAPEGVQFFNDAFQVTSTKTTAGNALVLKVEDYAYNDGVITIESSNVVEGDVVEVTVNLTLTITAPEARSIDVSATLENVKATKTDYLIRVPYAGEDTIDALADVNVNPYYTDEEIGKFFGEYGKTDVEDANYVNVLRFTRIIANNAKSDGYVAADWEGATMYAYNHQRTTITYVPETQEIGTAMAAKYYSGALASFTMKFTELDFDGEKELTFNLPAHVEDIPAAVAEEEDDDDDAVETPAEDAGWHIIVPNGPDFPLVGTITVKNPINDEMWKQGERLGTEGSSYNGYQREYNWWTFNDETSENYFVVMTGEHAKTTGTHDFSFEHARLFDALDATDEARDEGYKVIYEYVPEDYTLYAADETAGTFAVPSVDEDDSVIDWPLTYYNFPGETDDTTRVDAENIDEFLWKESMYNTATFLAKMVNEDKTIVYDTRIVKVVTEIPFANPVQKDTDVELAVSVDATVSQQLGEYLTMTNYVYPDMANPSTDLIHPTTFTLRPAYTSAECYGLSIKWLEKFEYKTTDGANIVLNAKLGEDGTFTVERNQNVMLHDFVVTATYEIEGNFGYKYRGTVEFKVVPAEKK